MQVHLNHANAQFRTAQASVAQNVAAAFEDTGAMSAAGVLTSGDPSTVLREGSVLMELSGSRSTQTTQLLTAAGQLAGHVSMYVGGGYMIDAPQTGMNVQKIPVNTGWYASTFVGAARP